MIKDQYNPWHIGMIEELIFKAEKGNWIRFSSRMVSKFITYL